LKPAFAFAKGEEKKKDTNMSIKDVCTEPEMVAQWKSTRLQILRLQV
jgi:hypothetical protein